MRSNVEGPFRAAVTRPQSRASRAIRPSIRKVADRGTTVLLAILIWLIFYQNLPGNFGLNPVPGEIFEASGGQGTANWLGRIVKLATLGICLGIVASRWKQARTLFKNINPGLTAFMLLIPLSAIWSVDSSATLLRFMTLASMVLVCFVVAVAGWRRERLQQLLVPPIMYVLIASLVLGSIYPDRVIQAGDDLSLKNAWHGITHYKNQFGITASIGVVLCFHHWLSGGRRAFFAIAGIAAGSACLAFSRSNSSQFATVISVFFMVLMMRVPVIKQRYSTHVVVGLAAILLLYEMEVQGMLPGSKLLLSPIGMLTGKDSTLSARTMIWAIIKDHISYARLLGSGYGAYWTGNSPASPSYVFMYLMYFYPSESHNGYLEIVNDLGLVGLACLLAFIYWFLRQALQLLRIDRSQATLYLALLFQQMAVNMTESEWFSRSLTSIVLLIATTCMARDLLEHRQMAPPTRPAHGLTR
jgi:exopolysaccharide production protein ExoQ